MELRKGLPILVVAALLATGLGACGDDDSGSRPQASSPRSQGEGGSGSSDSPSQASPGGAPKPDAQQGVPGDSGSRDFVPRQHDDSGGGSEQFRVKGGDNSVQEFGEEAEPSEFDAAATALHNFLDARAAEAWEAACSYLSAEIRKNLRELAARAKQGEDLSCGTILGKLTNRAALPELRREAAVANVGSLRIEGEQAFVIYRGLRNAIMAMPMANEDGTWKVGGLGGTPLN